MPRKKTVRPAFDDLSPLPAPWLRRRKSLWRQYELLGGWQLLADRLGVNVGTIYQFVVYGTIPGRVELRRALGIRPQGKPRPGFRSSVWYWENVLRWR